jgi:hypothetical protein
VSPTLASAVPSSQLYAWCPTCDGPRPCTIQQGTTDWQSTPVSVCRACGHVTHDPVIRLDLPASPAGSASAS